MAAPFAESRKSGSCKTGYRPQGEALLPQKQNRQIRQDKRSNHQEKQIGFGTNCKYSSHIIGVSIYPDDFIIQRMNVGL
jgi:hypothetical protein